MEREEVDTLYHLLRKASNIHSFDPVAALTANEQKSIYLGLARHLLGGLDYLALVQFSQYYGEKFLLEPVCNAIQNTGWPFSRVVDIGCGLGWLGRGIQGRFSLKPALLVDKRPWTHVDIVADLETWAGRTKLLDVLRRDDLLVMCDFLHCLSDPSGIMAWFSAFKTVAIELSPPLAAQRESYHAQLSRYGGNPMELSALRNVFQDRLVNTVRINQHIVLLVEPE